MVPACRAMRRVPAASLSATEADVPVQEPYASPHCAELRRQVPQPMFDGPRKALSMTVIPLLAGQSTSAKSIRASKSPGNLHWVPTWPPKVLNGGPGVVFGGNENSRWPPCSAMLQPLPKRIGYQIVPSI